MVMHFTYENDRQQALVKIRSFLEDEGFNIIEYAPEDAFLFTDYKLYDWGTGRRLLAVTVHINDKITITGMGKMDIPVSDLGSPEELQKIKSVDRLPYSIQKRTFLALIQPLNALGYKTINHSP
tara:strand:- start:1601 stop:1972 length:372 start_codon:yes stop_codon:yes gene_type:complete